MVCDASRPTPPTIRAAMSTASTGANPVKMAAIPQSTAPPAVRWIRFPRSPKYPRNIAHITGTAAVRDVTASMPALSRWKVCRISGASTPNAATSKPWVTANPTRRAMGRSPAGPSTTRSRAGRADPGSVTRCPCVSAKTGAPRSSMWV